MDADIRDERRTTKRGQGQGASHSSLAKLVINNAVKHCDFHNKAIEEQRMWRRHRKEQHESRRHRDIRLRERARTRSGRESRQSRHKDDAHHTHSLRKSTSRQVQHTSRRLDSCFVSSSDKSEGAKQAGSNSTEFLSAELEREYYNELRRRKRAALLVDATGTAESLPTMPRNPRLKDNLWRNV